MLSIHTNGPALAATNAMSSAASAAGIAATRLSTGKRVSAAKDDAAGLQIATRLASQMAGTQVAMRNIQHGVSLMQVTDDLLGNMSSMFIRMRDLAIQAADGSTTMQDRQALDAESKQLYEQAWVMYNGTYAGERLFADTTEGHAKFHSRLNLQIGAESANVLSADVINATDYIDEGFNRSSSVNLDLVDRASDAITRLSDTVDMIASARSTFGAIGNRLEAAYQSASNLLVNTTVAKGRIVDADFATESAESLTQQMLMQSSSSMLKESNSLKQMTISLLQ